MKTCTGCLEEKPDDAFYFNRVGQHWFSKCKPCCLADKRRWRATASPEMKERERARRRKNKRSIRNHLVVKARARGRAAGMEATIRTRDIYWPESCPVFNLTLDYNTPRGKRDPRNPALPSLDRWDNSKGYVPGNVYVISLRANQLKNNASAEELALIADYAKHGPIPF